MSLVVMLSVAYTECYIFHGHGECRYAEYLYGKFHVTFKQTKTKLEDEVICNYLKYQSWGNY